MHVPAGRLMVSSSRRDDTADPHVGGALEIILAAHGEAESAGFFENFRVGHRTLAHSAQVMRLPAPLRWVICALGAARKRLANGPGSPHNARTRAQAEALAAKLEGLLAEPVTVRAAFASSDPPVEALIQRPSAASKRIIISMSPSDSRLSCGLLCHALAQANPAAGQTVVLARLWDDPDFAALNAAHVRAACAAWKNGGALAEESKTALMLVFHGTLVRDQRDQAPAFHTGQAEKAHLANALKGLLPESVDAPWSSVVVAYLNHDVAGRWSQPTVGAVLEDLAQRGFERVWVFPCDFLVEGGEITGSLMSLLQVCSIEDVRLLPCLNDSPAFIDYLAGRVQRALSDVPGCWQCDHCPRPT